MAISEGIKNAARRRHAQLSKSVNTLSAEHADNVQGLKKKLKGNFQTLSTQHRQNVTDVKRRLSGAESGEDMQARRNRNFYKKNPGGDIDQMRRESTRQRISGKKRGFNS